MISEVATYKNVPAEIPINIVMIIAEAPAIFIPIMIPIGALIANISKKPATALKE